MRNERQSRLALAPRILLCGIVLAGAALWAANMATSQEQGTPPGATTGQPSDEEMAQMAAMMKLWQELATPGENHKALEHFVGIWNIKTRVWMGEPGAPPSVTQGTSKIRWVLDGRYLLEEVDSEMLIPDPMTGKERKAAFRGQGLVGYDNYKKMYVASWADNMSTQLLMSKGGYNSAKNVLTMYCEMDEPTMGLQDRLVKFVTRIIDKDKHVFEMYDLHAGDGHKVMEITYTRKK